MPSPVEQIKERLPIVTVVSSYIKLDRAGQNYKARCPFHNEKTPSFVVSPSRNAYHCFGCNRGGDVFSFVEEIEGVDFKEALRMLAERAGVTLERFDPRLKKEEDALRSALEEAAKFFEANLEGNPEALRYLETRGLAPATIREWRLGYAKDEWRSLLSHLAGKKVSAEDALRAGLLLKNEKPGVPPASRYYDRFRGRIMFPLSDAQGRLVGFSGRAFGGKAEEGAKYLNSPETPLFQKSRVLYGYDKAKSAMLKEGRAVLVEGQMDLVMSHQAGVRSAVASSGTAFTDGHARLIKRFAEKVILAFDGDDAGFAAAERTYLLLAPFGFEVALAKLPQGMDPADLAAKDADAWKKAADEAKHIVDYSLEALAERGYGERELAREISRRVMPLLRLVGNPLRQAEFVKKIAALLSVAEEAVWEELKKAPAPAMPAVEEAALPAERSRAALIDRKLVGMILWQESLPEEGRSVPKDARERYASAAGQPFPEDVADAPERILEAELQYENVENLADEFEELLQNRESERLGEELGSKMRLLRAAEAGKRDDEAERLSAECYALSRRLNELKRRAMNFK